MRTSQLAEKKQTLAGMHRYQRDLLVVLARRSLVRSGLPGRRMTRGSTGGPSWYPTIPNAPETLLGHLAGLGGWPARSSFQPPDEFAVGPWVNSPARRARQQLPIRVWSSRRISSVSIGSACRRP
jgi:hypothetical protein